MAVTLFSYVAATSSPYGGNHIVAWGAIVFGALQFFRSWSGRDDRPTTEDVGYDALEYGTTLETQGRVQEAVAVYKKIIATFPNSAASRDAQKSIENLKAKVG